MDCLFLIRSDPVNLLHAEFAQIGALTRTFATNDLLKLQLSSRS